MTKYMLNVVFDAHEGAMIRLLGLIQRRGFDVQAIDMQDSAGLRKNVTLTVAPLGNGQIDVLKRQIGRLQEVHDVVTLVPQQAEIRMFRMPSFPNFLRAAVTT